MTGPEANRPLARDRNATVDLGDADAVEKTTYEGNAHGTEPGDRREQNPGLTATVSAGRGMNPLAWVAIALAVLALIAYAVGLFS